MGTHLSQRLLTYRLVPLFHRFLQLYVSLLRIRVIGEEIALGCLTDYGRVIVAIWHQRLLLGLGYVTKFRNFEPIIMISQSRDGDLGARLAERLGLVPVRGSSSRGGATALASILRALKKNPAVIHIVDGPQGPKGVVKPGLITMAQLSGAVILPIIVSARKAWILGNWDRFLVPKPFSELTIEWGQPLAVPRGIDPSGDEDLRREIERRLTEGYAEADLRYGWKHPL